LAEAVEGVAFAGKTATADWTRGAIRAIAVAAILEDQLFFISSSLQIIGCRKRGFGMGNATVKSASILRWLPKANW
jgi:hypothetical protein